MRAASIATLCVCLCCCLVNADEWKPWDRFTSEEGRFSATFPVRPKVTKDNNGKIDTLQVSAKGAVDAEYMVFTAAIPALGEPLAILAKFVGGAFPKEAKDKVEIEQGGHKGYEIASEKMTADKARVFARSRVFYVDGRVYQVTSGSGTKPGVERLTDEQKADEKKFLDSFQITKGK
ncbi:MAG: hypothetical protein C0467_03495 [Planctomycetaceae bacterium]|nr:hypothetical protein [Planctomycetaceae bacterium]